ncbi:transposase, IS605 family, OrfA [Bacillus cereus SJ1]|nr:transposase, IS605 family, OrfA [Bacillus cereus SJ1]
MKNYISIEKATNILGKTQQTLWNWDKEGILVASMEESKKNTNTKKVYKKWLQTIQTWKEHHNWKLWSILHKTVYMSNQQFVFKI